MKSASLLSLVALASGALVQTTLAQVTITNEILFRDTFDVSSQSNDINLENSLRQSGNAAPLTYAANNGSNPDLIQLNNPDSPGRLRLNANGSVNLVSVSPNHNFTEGGEFTIEFDVDPGINDADSSSPDWAAVVFGATRQNVSVNGSDGMGILFRNQGDIQVFDGTTSIYGGNGDFPGGLPRTNFNVRIVVITADFQGSSPSAVSMFVNGTQVRISGADVAYVKTNGFRGNFVTLE